MTVDPALLRAALIGYENQLAQIDKAMAEIRRQLRATGSSTNPAPEKEHRRGMSAAARKRIAAAQKKRWAAYRKSKKSK